MKKLSVLALIVIIFLSSCTRYTVEGAGSGGCGVWMPKKYKGDRAPRTTAARMPVIQ